MSPDTEQLLQAWLDGEMPAADRAQIEAIIAADTDAAAYVDSLQNMGDRLRSAPLPGMPEGAQARWIREWQITRDRSVRRLASWMTLAASVVLGITLSTALSRPAQAQPVLAEWETAAVAGVEDDDAPRTARVIAIDLALPQAGDVSREGSR
ncbi:MAG: hypothetical protein JWM57_3935 [Phycisphaerales bacterium]|nr:hypothetical protein [Phycisphaerales bacterium]